MGESREGEGADMSASDKSHMMFFLPHVIGHQAHMVPADVRYDLLNIIARAQLMLIASSGRRQYTKAELNQIYDKGYNSVFRSLERIFHSNHDATHAQKTQAHERRPDRHAAPKRYVSKHRSVWVLLYYIVILRTLCSQALSKRTILGHGHGRYGRRGSIRWSRSLHPRRLQLGAPALGDAGGKCGRVQCAQHTVCRGSPQTLHDFTC